MSNIHLFDRCGLENFQTTNLLRVWHPVDQFIQLAQLAHVSHDFHPLRRRDVQGSGGNVRPQLIEAFHQGGHQPQGHVLATAQVGLGDLIALCV